MKEVKPAVRRILAIVAAVCLLGPVDVASSATLWVGSCVVDVTLNFDTPVRGNATAPGYSIDLRPSLVDYAPDALTGWPGNQNCLVEPLDPTEPQRESFGFGDGTSTIWTCATASSGGAFQQDWYDSDNNLSPPNVVGQHFIAGTWGDWTFTLTGTNFIGIAHLTTSPFENLKFQECAKLGFMSLTMTGVMEFSDPAP
jgi:hypothetical protein